MIPDQAHESSGQRRPFGRLLVLSEHLPRADESAGHRRLLELLRLLARNASVDLWVERDETAGRRALTPARLAEARAGVAAAGAHVLAGGWRALMAALDGPAYAAVLFEFHAMATRYAALVRGRQAGTRIVVDSVDLEFARRRGGAAIGVERAWAAHRRRRRELTAYRAADAVLVASTDDACTLAVEADLPPVYCVPTIVAPRPRAPGPRDREALFVGHFDHRPNVDGLVWFVGEVWPRARAAVRDARLIVLGSRVPDAVRALGARPGVTVLGYVPDVAPFLDRMRLAVAPLRYGAGMKGKVTEAMAAGVPVVTTPVGVQGLAVVSGEHALVAADAPAFAAAVGVLLHDPELAERVGISGQRLVGAVCAPEVVEPEVCRLLAETLEQPLRRTAGRPAAPGAALAGWLRCWRLAGRHAAVSGIRRQAQWLTHRV